MDSVLIMAGGRSSRMRSSLGRTHKALVPILGVPMLERNLIWLLALGFREIYVAVAEAEREVIDFANTRCRSLASAFDAKLELVMETTPLGNIGACRLCPPTQELLVVYVDNLTDLDLRAMLAMHRQSGAAMTIA